MGRTDAWVPGLRRERRQRIRMDSAVTFILLLGFWTVGSSPGRQSVHFSMVFSSGTRLLVDIREGADYGEDDDLLPRQSSAGSSVRPSVEVLSSVRLSEDRGSPHLLVCVLGGLASPRQQVLWWLDDRPVSAGSEGPRAESGGGYSAVSVWEVSAADWRSTSSFWCGTVQDGRRHRWRLCSDDEHHQT